MSDTSTASDHQIAQVDPLLDERTLSEELFELLLERRGWTRPYLEQIENPEHPDLLDLDKMVNALHQAKLAGKKITIAPDFDMDGITSGVLGYAGLSELGFNVELHLPDYRRGHDLSPEDIEEIHQRFPDTDVLLTCDGGVNSHRGIAAARAKGWMTLVTDHHQELEPGSTADITVNPCRIDDPYPNKGICGAHVLFQVIERYTRNYMAEKSWEIRLLKLFAGIGTVSDVMPILKENRAVLRDSLSIARLLHVSAPKPHGEYSKPEPDKINIQHSALLQMLNAEAGSHSPVFIAAFEGFAIALKAFAENGKLRDRSDLDEGFYGFYLSPAMNSPRRTGAPLDDCFKVFLPLPVSERLAAMHRIIENNDERKRLVAQHRQDMDRELDEEMQPLAPWVWFSNAPKGMFGLLANQIMQETGHPVVVVNRPSSFEDSVSGSARAPLWFNVISTLEAHGKPGLSAIGHQQACGVKAGDVNLLIELIGIMRSKTEENQALAATQGDQRHGDLILGDQPDADAQLVDSVQLGELVRMVESLRPFGHAFAQPVYEVRIGFESLRVQCIGTDSQHLRLTTRDGLSVLWWNQAQHFDQLTDLAQYATGNREEDIMPQPVPPLRAVAKMQQNTFMGNTRLQIVIDNLVDDLHDVPDEARVLISTTSVDSAQDEESEEATQ